MTRKGFTLIEIMLSVAIMTMVLLPTAFFISQSITYFRSQQMRTQLLSDALTCRNTVSRFMRLGSAKTLQISTDFANNAPPNSHASFTRASDGTAYDFSWVDNTVVMNVTPPGLTTNASTIASKVIDLKFIVPDPGVPTQVLLSIRLSAPVDGKHTAAATLTSQLIQMLP